MVNFTHCLLCISPRPPGAARIKYHSFREFNQEKEKTWRAGSESAPPPLPEAEACPWGEGASKPICKRRKCGWEKAESRTFGELVQTSFYWGERMIIIIIWSIIIIRDRKQAQVILAMVKSHESDSHSWFKGNSNNTCSGRKLDGNRSGCPNVSPSSAEHDLQTWQAHSHKQVSRFTKICITD